MPKACQQRPDESDSDYAIRLAEHRRKRCEYAKASNKRKGPRLNAARMERYRADPEYRNKIRTRMNDYRKRTRTVPEDHDGACEVCGITPKRKKNGHSGLFVDHRHDNGVIRGYLCVRCNSMVATLDLAHTNPELFAKLMEWSNRGLNPEPGARKLTTHKYYKNRHK